MKIIKKTILATTLLAMSTGLTASAIQGNRLEEALSEVAPTEEVEEVVIQPIETKEQWVLPFGNLTEQKVLNALQERGITDRNAIANVMGNIKQESKFNANICEGGARVSYWGCRSGGYGLIQWTTIDRYRGLGNHAYRIGLDPSTVDAQISFLFTERQWRRIEPSLKTNGYSIGFYMQKSYYWLGWGIHGNRTTYAHQYAAKLISMDIPIK